MPRGFLLILCVVLVGWWPIGFAVEVAETLPTIGMRGAAGVVELLFHGAVAALAVAAVRTVWTAMPAGPILAAAALVASAAASVQSLYWSVLPHQTKPGDELPLAILSVLHAAAWLVYLSRSRRVREMAS
jgi:hypothetical protein